MKPPRWRMGSVHRTLKAPCPYPPAALSSRHFSSNFASRQSQQQDQSSSSSKAPMTADLSPRWLSDLRSRIGKCIQFGCSAGQVQEAGAILQELARDWRELVAGSEGFLTSEDRRGLFRQDVVWGEMVSLSFLQVSLSDLFMARMRGRFIIPREQLEERLIHPESQLHWILYIWDSAIPQSMSLVEHRRIDISMATKGACREKTACRNSLHRSKLYAHVLRTV